MANADETDWTDVGDSPTVRTQYRFRVCPDGSVDLDIKQSLRDPEAFMAQIAIERAAAEALGWREGAVIGRVPDAYYFSSGLHDAAQQRDKPWLAKFWNDADHKRLRIKEGRV